MWSIPVRRISVKGFGEARIEQGLKSQGWRTENCLPTSLVVWPTGMDWFCKLWIQSSLSFLFSCHLCRDTLPQLWTTFLFWESPKDQGSNVTKMMTVGFTQDTHAGLWGLAQQGRRQGSSLTRRWNFFSRMGYCHDDVVCLSVCLSVCDGGHCV